MYDIMRHGTTQPLERILVCEDTDDTREVIVQLLQHAGYRMIEAADGATALRLLEEEQPALVIMDVNIPECGGFGVVETMRRRGFNQPVLFLTAYSDMDYRVKGLGIGADDYMTKPFDARELQARVAALLRRVQRSAPAVRRISLGEVTIDFDEKVAHRAGAAVGLTATEFSILELLAREAGRPVSRERMLDAVWGYQYLPNTRTVETHIWRLRKKLGDSGRAGWIQNRPGLGYVLATAAVPGGDGAPDPEPEQDVAMS